MRRTKIRKYAFLTALIAVLLAWAVTETVQCRRYRTAVSLTQQRALLQTGEYLGNIETDLKKARVSGTAAMLSSLAADLSTQAAGAKTGLSALAAGETSLANTYKFLSQVGAYTDALGKRVSGGGTIGGEDREMLSRLLSYAEGLKRRFDYMCELMDGGYLRFEKINETLAQTEENSEQMLEYMQMASGAEDAMTDFPTLLYDGPFSDNILSKTSVLLENAKEISAQEAKKKAAALLQADARYVFYDGESEGRIGSYRFHYEDTAIAITKRGGYPAFLLSPHTAGEAAMAGKDAVSRAAAFLYTCGYKDMTSSYYAVEDGVCTVNFAYRDGEYTCYPDLIKVGVSLKDGRIVSLDAADYLMNHVRRTPPAVGVERASAEQAAAGNLTVKKVKKAVIPTGGGYEKFAWELLCGDENGQDVLVYVDEETGEEAEILLLLYSDGGTLTK